METMVYTGGFGQMFGVPNAVVDQYLRLATPSQLKVLLYLLRHNSEPLEHCVLSRAIGISEELVEEALLFWSQTDLFSMQTNVEPSLSEAVSTPATGPQQLPESTEKAKPVHTFPLVGGKRGELTPIEIAAALEASEDLKLLFRMAEQQLGRPLRHVEQKSLVWLHDYDNIGSDIILTVLSYCQTIEKASVSAAEAMIVSWWNQGFQSLGQITEAINEVEYRRSFTGHIRKAFEMQRKPTPKQQGFIDKWQDMGVPLELVTYAYEKTLENADKLSFPYLDAILTRWMEAGYRTRTDVDEKDHPVLQENRKIQKTKPAVPESDNAQAYQSFIYNLDES